MIEETNTTVDLNNSWRLETPGHDGWKRSARPGDPNRYLMISTDCHCNEPSGLWAERMDEKYRKRLPHIETDENGVKWMVSEGWQKSRAPDFAFKFEGEDLERNKSGYDPKSRIKDHARDGIDAEIIFPNKGLLMWATQDAEFGAAQCRVYNDWAWETFGPYNSFMSPMAAIMTVGRQPRDRRDRARREAGLSADSRCRASRSSATTTRAIPTTICTMYDPMWAAIQDHDLPITFHISTGRDPRAARKDGGAVINYVSHSLSPTIEPIANLCASGVIERFPKIRFAGDRMRHRLGAVGARRDGRGLPQASHVGFPEAARSCRANTSAATARRTFQEDRVGLDLAVKYNLVDNFMWANDYPHHEGVVAAFGGIDRASDGPSERRTAREDPRTERRAHLQIRR